MFGSASCAANRVNGALIANAPTRPAASVARTRNRYDVVAAGTRFWTTLVDSAAGRAVAVHVAPPSVDCCRSYRAIALPSALGVPDHVNVTGTAVVVNVACRTMLGTGAVADGAMTVPFTTSAPEPVLAKNVPCPA